MDYRTGIGRSLTVLEVGMKGWVLDGIAKEAAAALALKSSRLYLATRLHHHINVRRAFAIRLLRKSDVILFLHFRPFFRVIERLPNSNVRVFITHLDSKEQFGEREIRLLNKASRVIFQNKAVLDYAVELGLSREKCLVGHGAVSEKVFYPLIQLPRKRYVLISGECKPRKNPELVVEVIRANPDIAFLVHGKGWDDYISNRGLRNVELQEFDLARQADLMREASAFMSLSSNEGGPFPVIEALASGTPVISTQTGFAPELVSKESGMVLSKTPTLDEISLAIRHAIMQKEVVLGKNLLPRGHDWNSFAEVLFLR